jgi:hypothetical protein
MLSAVKHKLKYMQYLKNLEVFHTSSESNRWLEFAESHNTSRKSFQEKVPTEGIQKYIDSYKQNGFFAYHDDDTERLCKIIYNKLKAQGYIDAPIAESENKSFLTHPSREIYPYTDDTYQSFPEIEQIFRGKIGDIIRGIFGCNFDIFYSRIHKAQNLEGDERDGSQLWHTDGGPSNCMIMFFHFTDVGEHNGGTEILPWDISKEIYKKTYFEYKNTIAGKNLDKQESRYVKSCIFEKEININHKKNVVTLSQEKPGLIAAMNNNNLHRGGFTRPGYHRVILMTHLYPIDKPTPFDKYRNEGTPKTSPIPYV